MNWLPFANALSRWGTASAKRGAASAVAFCMGTTRFIDRELACNAAVSRGCRASASRWSRNTQSSASCASPMQRSSERRALKRKLCADDAYDFLCFSQEAGLKLFVEKSRDSSLREQRLLTRLWTVSCKQSKGRSAGCREWRFLQDSQT